jgi:hypothetical protein
VLPAPKNVILLIGCISFGNNMVVEYAYFIRS